MNQTIDSATLLDKARFEAHKERFFLNQERLSATYIANRIIDLAVIQSGKLCPDVDFWSDDLLKWIKILYDNVIHLPRTVKNEEILFLISRQIRQKRYKPEIDSTSLEDLNWLINIRDFIAEEMQKSNESSIEYIELKEKKIDYDCLIDKTNMYLSGEYKKIINDERMAESQHDKQLDTLEETVKCNETKLEYLNRILSKEEDNYNIADLKLKIIETRANIEAKKRYLEVFRNRL